MTITVLIPPYSGHVFYFEAQENKNSDFIPIRMFLTYSFNNNKNTFEIKENEVIKNFIESHYGFREHAKNNYYCCKNFEIEFADCAGKRSGKKRKLTVKINNESVDFLYNFMIDKAVFILEKE